MWIDLGNILLVSLASLAALFLLCKLMGNKQISQLSMFDYITGISIGSIAAEMATELDEPLQGLVAMVVYALVAFGISALTSRSLKMRKLFTGRPILLMDAGVIYRENMRKARFDLSDFLTLCRINGYFNLADIQTAILEENGTVSFLPKSEARPMAPRDVERYPKQEQICTNVVLDGTLLYRSLAALHHDEDWLNQELKQLGYDSYKDVYLATVDSTDQIAAYPMQPDKRRFSPFD